MLRGVEPRDRVQHLQVRTLACSRKDTQQGVGLELHLVEASDAEVQEL